MLHILIMYNGWNLCNMDTMGPIKSVLIFQVSLCLKCVDYAGVLISSVHINRFHRIYYAIIIILLVMQLMYFLLLHTV